MAVTMVKEAAASKSQSSEQKQGEEGDAFGFHLYSPYFSIELRVRLAE